MSKVINLGQYKELEVTVEKPQVADADVEQQLKTFVERTPMRVEKVDGVIEKGDIATFDFEGFKDGVPFEGGKSENFPLEIGSGQFIPGFEDQMIGMAKDEERDLHLTFPVNYQAQDLAGKEVVFKVKVHKIEMKQKAELNDEFVASLKMNGIETVEQLRETMRQNMQAQLNQQYGQRVETAVFEALINASEVEVTDEDVKAVVELQIQQMTMSLAQQGMTLEQYLGMTGTKLDDFKKNLEPAATKEAKFEALIDQIVVKENLTVTDEEADEQIEGIANQNHMTKEQVLERLPLDVLKRDYGRVKASQLILQSAKVNN